MLDFVVVVIYRFYVICVVVQFKGEKKPVILPIIANCSSI